MAGTTIDGLNSVTSLTAQDEVPVWDAEASGEPTKKITASNLAASVKTLGSLVNTTEMNNALAGKQNTLTFDTTPTTGSTNPVTSGGTATAISQSTASKANRHVYTTSGSFNSASVSSYVNNVLETIRTGIADYSSGVSGISSGTGPRFGVVLYKLNATYWSAMLMTYASSDGTLYYAKYENGTCIVIAIN